MCGQQGEYQVCVWVQADVWRSSAQGTFVWHALQRLSTSCPALNRPATQLEKEVQREKALAEAEGRAQERRQNKDIYQE